MGVGHDRGTTSLTRFQRMLVGTDGTVTHLLEAYAGEPMEVVKLLQELETLDDVDPELDLAAGEKVLRRRVVLRGRHSGNSLLHAEALVALSRVEPGFVDTLVTTEKPLGIVLAERRAETFREILTVGLEPAGPVGGHFGLDPTAAVVARTYRIVADGRPLIVVTEKFPEAFFRSVPA
ncbi:MAG TPA: chorismate pyruvate-lyase family protein [Acidimicrobiales bacterium]|nr:chorismate pyruvate-lyase family protein [Acidimicrobiales bacterium]